jgi:5-methylcytosine-specific restriction protein B
LVKDGYIDGSIRGIWTLTVKGQKAKMTKETASDIFKKWQVILEERRNIDQEAYPAGYNVSEKRYWIYAPGNNASKWPEFYAKGIMGIGWEEMGNLEQYASKNEMKTKMKELYGKDYSYMNIAHATWQFANELEPGDIVYAKKGLHKIVGKGVIESGYIYDAKRAEYTHIRKVKWTHNGEWEHPGQAVAKTLTDITPDPYPIWWTV